jgi:hypothetical protein
LAHLPTQDSLSPFDSLDRAFIERHSRILAESYRHWTGRPLIEGESLAIVLFEAPFALLSHGTEADPLFNYANRQAMALFRMDWQQIIGLPSRLSAEPMLREAREALLARVAQHGYVDDYSGVRIASDGSRFMIHEATVWNLLDEQGQTYGQAALIKRYIPL